MPVIMIKAIRTGISAVAGLVFGLITGWIYYGFLLAVNAGKKRHSLSPDITNKLQKWYPSVDLGKVRIVGSAKGVPRGKTAVTHGNSIFIREKFSENNCNYYELLLHELVHVEQYKKYGKGLFYVLYGFQYLKAGFSYHGIELEKEAFNYEKRQSSQA